MTPNVIMQSCWLFHTCPSFLLLIFLGQFQLVFGCESEFNLDEYKDDVLDKKLPPYYIKSESGCKYNPSHEKFPKDCVDQCPAEDAEDDDGGLFKCLCIYCHIPYWNSTSFPQETCLNWIKDECPAAFGEFIAIVILIIILITTICCLLSCFCCCRNTFDCITKPCRLLFCCCKSGGDGNKSRQQSAYTQDAQPQPTYQQQAPVYQQPAGNNYSPPAQYQQQQPGGYEQPGMYQPPPPGGYEQPGMPQPPPPDPQGMPMPQPQSGIGFEGV